VPSNAYFWLVITVKTVYSGELRTEATHVSSGKKIITDAPPDNQGKGEAFSPTDLLAASLGSCMLTLMGISARNHQFNIDGTSIEVTKIMAADPRRVIEIIVEFSLPDNNYSESQLRLLRHAAVTCPVALSLNPEIKQQVIFK
jgi:uncharacterized OsmC-like protein